MSLFRAFSSSSSWELEKARRLVGSQLISRVAYFPNMNEMPIPMLDASTMVPLDLISYSSAV